MCFADENKNQNNDKETAQAAKKISHRGISSEGQDN